MYYDPVVLQWLLTTLFLGPKLNVGTSLKKRHTSNINSSMDRHPEVLLKARRQVSKFWGLDWVFLPPVIPKCVAGGLGVSPLHFSCSTWTQGLGM